MSGLGEENQSGDSQGHLVFDPIQPTLQVLHEFVLIVDHLSGGIVDILGVTASTLMPLALSTGDLITLDLHGNYAGWWNQNYEIDFAVWLLSPGFCGP